MLMTRSRPAGEVRLDRSAPPAPAPLPLDADQRAVVEHGAGHLLVLAGPGTGKTATLAELVVGRIHRSVDPVPAEAILALTFGRRAAGELSERISRRLGGGPMPVVSTFHSFAYGALRAHADPAAFLEPPRLLTAAEQEARLRELLTGAIGDGRLEWPASLAGAVGTRGIAEQVRALLARARAQGLDGRALSTFGRRAGIPVWQAVGAFFEEYLDTLGFEGTIDYAELIHRAAVLAHDPRAGRGLRERFRLVVVDEYQDTDPAQVALLRGLASGGAQVVAVGDPDQSIFGFRGADVRGILAFPDVFADPSGRPARIVVLQHTRRYPEPIARAAHGVLGPISLAPLPADVQRRHRSPVARPGPAEVQVRTFTSGAAEAAGIAEALLRAHAGVGDGSPEAPDRGLAWREMAVLVRNPALHGPRLVRALRAAGIPVGMPPAETPIAQEPGARTLISLLELALGGDDLRRDAGRSLLAGPVGRVDAVSLRQLGRRLLRAAEGGHSDALLTELVAGRVDVPEGCPRVVGEGIARVRAALEAAHRALSESATVSDVLWAAWSATDWPGRLRGAALGGDRHAASAADRDLDALLVLFDLANRLPVHRRGRTGLAAFLDDVRAMRLPIEGRMGTAPDRDEVRLMSAHRAKGLEFELVVVAAVQEGQWPDLRLRSDLLRVAELGPRGRVDPQSRADVMAEERRLMYVACTRARSRLLVTAVSEPLDGGAEPSRFLRELGVPIEHVAAQAPSPLTGPGLVMALREAACAPARLMPDGRADPVVEALRNAALQRLAVLASRAGGGDARAALGAADPERWWWARSVTGDEVGSGPGPLGPDRAALDPAPDPAAADPAVPALSASAVTALLRCPLRWFLDRRVDAGPQSGTSAAVGLVVHAVAEALVRGAVTPDAAAVGRLIDEIWDAMPFAAHYERDRERTRVGEMVAALLAWHGENPRAVIAAELGFRVTVPIDGMEVVLRGSIDRVEADSEGRVHLVDLKTGKVAASAAEAADHPQLGVYQLAVLHGALGDLGPQDPAALAPGGAELVHVGALLSSGMPRVRHQAGLSGERTWAHEIVAEAARLSTGPRFPARRNSRCATCPYRALCPAGAAQPVGPAEGGADHA